MNRLRLLVEVACAARTLWEVYEFARERMRRKEEERPKRVVVCDRWGPVSGGGP